MRTSAGPNAEGIRRVENKASLANAQFENGMQSAGRLWCAQLGFMQEGGIVIGPSKFVGVVLEPKSKSRGRQSGGAVPTGPLQRLVARSVGGRVCRLQVRARRTQKKRRHEVLLYSGYEGQKGKRNHNSNMRELELMMFSR